MAIRRHVPIADARNRLTQLIRDAEAGEVTELTRRGAPVAVLLSMERYQALTARKNDFGAAYTRFRRSHDLEALDREPDPFEGLRDRSPGRPVRL